VRLSELIAICRRELAGVRDAAPAEAEILVSAATGIPRSRLFLSMDDDVGDASVRLLPRIARRAAGEPLQYVLGAWDFFGREFLLSPDTLIPRPETEGLAERAVAALRRSTAARPLALDVGTGCGAIAVTLAAEVPAARVVATELDGLVGDDLEPAHGNANPIVAFPVGGKLHGPWSLVAPPRRLRSPFPTTCASSTSGCRCSPRP